VFLPLDTLQVRKRLPGQPPRGLCEPDHDMFVREGERLMAEITGFNYKEMDGRILLPSLTLVLTKHCRSLMKVTIGCFLLKLRASEA